MEFPSNALDFMDLLVTEHKRRLRSRRPSGETFRYMGETLEQQGRGEDFLKLWVHNAEPNRPDPSDPQTDLALLQIYEHWRRHHHLRPIEAWDGSKLRPWLSPADNPTVPSALAGDLTSFRDAMTRAPGEEVPWRRLDALGHAIEAYFTQVRRHAVWARPGSRPRSAPIRSASKGGHSHSISHVEPTEALGALHADHGTDPHASHAREESEPPIGELRLYFHNELNNIETAPYSVRFWGFLKWADNLRRRLLNLPIADFKHDEWSDIAFADRLVVRHFTWHDDVFSMGPSPRWDDQLGRYQTHRYPMGSQGYGVEFFRFHRDLINAYDEWLVQAGQPKVRPWHSGKHHTSYVLKYAWDWWWGRGGTNGRCLDPQVVAPELMDPKLSAFDTLAELGHYLDVCGVTYHGVGHVQNCDIRDPYCNNYSIRFFAWHRWIDHLFKVLEKQGKPLFDASRPLDAPVSCGKWKTIPDPEPFLNGVWTYRSFHNDPNPDADPVWFIATLELRQYPDGSLRGRLDSGDPDYVYDVSGFIDETSVRYEMEPEWWDDRLMIVMHGVGATPATEGHEYEYVAYYQPSFPTGKDQIRSFVGSVLRSKRPDDPTKEGKVGSFTAVLRGPLTIAATKGDYGSGASAFATAPIVPGQVGRLIERSETFIVPEAVTELLVRAWGGGGGGGSDGPGVGDDNGKDGGTSSVNDSVFAHGGKGGQHGVYQLGDGGAGGAASGGSVNLPGGAGEKGGTVTDESGQGGSAQGPGGGAGGARVGKYTHGAPGTFPGGGGSGAQEGNTPAGGGGAGGYAEARLTVTPGSPVQVVVGPGGLGGDGGYRVGGNGASGRVELSWQASDAQARGKKKTDKAQ